MAHTYNPNLEIRSKRPVNQSLSGPLNPKQEYTDLKKKKNLLIYYLFTYLHIILCTWVFCLFVRLCTIQIPARGRCKGHPNQIYRVLWVNSADAGNWTQFLCESSLCPYPLSHLSSPRIHLKQNQLSKTRIGQKS